MEPPGGPAIHRPLVTSDLRISACAPGQVERGEWEALVERTPVPPGLSQRFDACVVDAAEGIQSSFLCVRDEGGQLVGGARVTMERRFPSRHLELNGGPLLLPGFEDSVPPLIARQILESLLVVDSGLVRPSPGRAWRLEEFGLHRSAAPVETLVVDLRPTEAELWRAVDHSVRQGVRKARDHGMTIRELTEEREIETIYPIVDRFGRHRDFAIISEHRLRATHRVFHPSGRWHILVGERGSVPTGVAFIWITNQQAGLLVLASAPEFAKVQLTSLLAWESIRFSRAHGATSFDFLGLPPAGSALEGVRRFKLKWGGVVVPGEEYLEGVMFRFATGLVRRYPKLFESVMMQRGPFRHGIR